MYCMNAFSLWVEGKIDFSTLLYVLRERPDAVAGRGGAYHVALTDPNETSQG